MSLLVLLEPSRQWTVLKGQQKCFALATLPFYIWYDESGFKLLVC